MNKFFLNICGCIKAMTDVSVAWRFLCVSLEPFLLETALAAWTLDNIATSPYALHVWVEMKSCWCTMHGWCGVFQHFVGMLSFDGLLLFYFLLQDGHHDHAKTQQYWGGGLDTAVLGWGLGCIRPQALPVLSLWRGIAIVLVLWQNCPFSTMVCYFWCSLW